MSHKTKQKAKLWPKPIPKFKFKLCFVEICANVAICVAAGRVWGCSCAAWCCCCRWCWCCCRWCCCCADVAVECGVIFGMPRRLYMAAPCRNKIFLHQRQSQIFFESTRRGFLILMQICTAMSCSFCAQSSVLSNCLHFNKRTHDLSTQK